MASGSNRLRSKGNFPNWGSTSSSKASTFRPTFSKAPLKNEAGNTSKPQGANNIGSRKCFKRQGYGHIAADCPNRRIVTLVEEREEEEEELIQGEFEAEDVTFADEGELLVCRNLSIQREEDDEWLRHNIFHTRCTSHGKVCDVIIDGGSFENVISSNMVEKL